MEMWGVSMKKLFALVLCLVLVLAGMPVGAEEYPPPQTYRVTVEVIGQGTVRGRTADDEPGSYPLEVVNNTGNSISGSIEIPEGSPSLELTWMGADGFAIAQTYQIVQPADGLTQPVNENIPGDNKITVNGEM